jgi:putative transposase
MLQEAVKVDKARHPFEIHGWVVLPEHFHFVLELQPDDTDYATRLRLIKVGFSKALPKTERRSAVSVRRGERGIYPRAQVATPVLGTFDPGRSRLPGAPGLCPL